MGISDIPEIPDDSGTFLHIAKRVPSLSKESQELSMTSTKASLLRDWAGRAGALFCILLFLSLLDAFIAGFREPLHHLSFSPGQEMAVTGPSGEKMDDLRKLTYLSNSRDIRLVFDSVQTGFWFGGYMWRGRILVSREIQPGQYKVVVPRDR